MNWKTCKILNDKFKLDEKYNVFLNTEKNIEVTDGLEKGYIYAAMFFYDEIDKEMRKLEKIIGQELDMILLESPEMDVGIMLIELSRRVKSAIGDDSLEGLIKEVLARSRKHIALSLEPKEAEKLDFIKESILTETIHNLYKTMLEKPEKDEDGYKKLALTQSYADKLTERQKRLITPALKMVGFLNGIKVDSFEIKDFNASFKLYAVATPFAAKEEAIKKNLKKMIAEHT